MRTQRLAAHRARVAAGALVLTGMVAALAVAAPAAAGGSRDGRPGPAASRVVYRTLYGVAAISAGNAWAVGQSGPAWNGDQPAGYTFILHWNGRAWKRVPSPSPGIGAILNGVAAASARSAWAVGSTDASDGTPPETVILRWNGTAWRRVPSPDPRYAFLDGVAAAPAGGAWVVGGPAPGNPDTQRTVILDWSGAAWMQVPVPGGQAYGDSLSSVAAASARSRWAVGATSTGTTLIMRWNGTWRRVPSQTGALNGDFAGVAAFAGGAWAVGEILRPVAGGAGTNPYALIERWSATRWKRVASPHPAGDFLYGVAATSARNAWAVGYTWQDHGEDLILHWNGTTWKRVASPSLSRLDGVGSVLYAVTATSARNAWAVGYAAGRSLILHWNGRSWRRIPSP